MTPRRALLAVAAAMLAAVCGHAAWDDWVDRTVLPVTIAETSFEMRDRDGHLMRAFGVENGRIRLAVPPGSVDPQLVRMLLTYEDKRFRRHNGVDGLAMARAVGQALRHGRIVSGGSTLTMQVARLLENGSTGSVRGKLRQMRVAWALERRLDKDRILHLYLQHAPYGGRIEGVRSASFVWFGKEPHRLSPVEAALLVALPQSPESRRPDRHPEAARAARDRVLARNDLPASAAPVPRSMRPLPRHAPHLADALRLNFPGADRMETTLLLRTQQAMERLVALHARRLPPGASAALMVADHQTGEVLARVGAPDYSDAAGALGYIDMTRAVRSPGSTLKPVIYALAFDRGLAHPATIVADRPMRFGRYAPQNFDGRFRGDVTMARALQLSLNLPVVALTERLGPERLMATLRAFGARPEVPDGRAGLAIALGGLGASLEDLVTVYAGLARMGLSQDLRDRPGLGGATARVIAARAAWQVAEVLRGMPPPAGARAGLAYKTGTSYGHRDAWAIGFDGRHVIGVWMGRPDGTAVPGAFGGDLAAPLLFEAFGRLKPAYDPLPPPPADVLTLTNADLPPPLRRFGASDASDGPQVVYPPDGAVLGQRAAVLKVDGGTLPLTVLLNGAPITTGARGRQIDLGTLDVGHSRISVIDATGRSARVAVEARP